ncbi:MAG: Holliday junction resolvase RuvX [Candidatus Pacebacteria bacterium]|nr:Holliday junction resolvase RuvX [Candidatus Paceibacterota bacterium]PIR64021.1 MAG: Holliday junction resolvase RuvX [Candidatus Pacebacteria bacterium CG10_big_fil_rev_8_21_14_0_10_40_26]PIZ79644.1 MAG: Holliday junction resolvase RuvX [Candidatus Pacebacteria bacterium CG_4_10_14_0_2_um_filter_40_20]PJA69097.1 MAG: Holliday junction resolvase RuvX [Candidatus Pacebacteria bacterium CG_4_9_14_3_um_filter_40_12]PJC41769.1 MAG: Holliday junction resolvase RuvX [Candidatus Pacebacteria bacte
MIPKCLAIDFGTVRIGLAVSRATLADPLTIIQNSAESIAVITKIIEEEEIQQIVVGISEREMAEKTRKFVQELQKTISLPIVYTDETLSSKTVHEKLLGAKRAKRQGSIDHYAAAEFLQQWIETQEAQE